MTSIFEFPLGSLAIHLLEVFEGGTEVILVELPVVRVGHGIFQNKRLTKQLYRVSRKKCSEESQALTSLEYFFIIVIE